MGESKGTKLKTQLERKGKETIKEKDSKSRVVAESLYRSNRAFIGYGRRDG